jgi:hypothetical protein
VFSQSTPFENFNSPFTEVLQEFINRRMTKQSLKKRCVINWLDDKRLRL